MTILITGGAGYIGSHVVKQLLETTDYNIVVLDNLSTGSQKTLDTLQSIAEDNSSSSNHNRLKVVIEDLKNFSKISNIFDSISFDAILHFAASVVVPESVENPLKYYLNNTVNTTYLIECAVKHNVKKFIFSSTAAVYGAPNDLSKVGVDETYPTNPINPYGRSKLMSEKVLYDTALVESGFNYVIFRYFNVAGADIHYDKTKKLVPRIGQRSPNATHLIKIASECAEKKRDEMFVFGNDFDTEDGTGVRDYIHVDDLASAHIKAIDYLEEENKSDIFNLGYGVGYSVNEVIETMKNVSKFDFTVEVTTRRRGDPAWLVADNSYYKQAFSKYFELENQPIFKYNNIKTICESAYQWEKITNSSNENKGNINV